MGAALRDLASRLLRDHRAALVAVTLLPLLLLLQPFSRFYFDWNNHVWLIAWFGEHLKAHLAFPFEVNTGLLVGLPNTLFYGYPLYAAGGLLSALVGADLAIRALVLAVTAWQVVSVYRLARAYGSDRAMAVTVAALGAWSTYALTNLYNRSAMTEYFSVSLLWSAFATMLRALPARSPRERFQLLAQAAFAAVLAALVHPITGLLGGPLLLVTWLLVLAWTPDRGALLRQTLLAGLPALGAVAGWGALFLRLGSKLQVNGVLGEVRYYPFDNLVTRLLPFPYDDRSIAAGIVDVHTPYLDTQANTAMLALVVALPLAVRWWPGGAPGGDPVPVAVRAVPRGFGVAALAVAAAGFLLALALSLPTPLSGLLTGLLRNVQFGCRFVSYQNLFLLLGFVGMTQLLAGRSIAAQARTVLLAVALTAGVLSVTVKLFHGDVLRFDTPAPWATPRETAAMPRSFYGLNDFCSTPQRSVIADERFARAYFPVGADGFGTVGPVDLDLPRATLVTTNLLYFEDNTLLLDGVPIPRDQVALALNPVSGQKFRLDKEYDLVNTANGTAFLAPPGKHRLERAYTPPPGWRGLFVFSNLVLLAWGLALLAWRLRWPPSPDAACVDSPLAPLPVACDPSSGPDEADASAPRADDDRGRS